MKKFVWLIAFLIVGCSDVMDNYYPTYQDALENKLFTRGWLPNILPESTKKIEVSNDLDLNTSVGRFVIDKQDRDAFISQLTLVDIKKIALNIIPAKVFGHLIWKTMALFVIRCQLIDNVLANITYIQNIRTD